MPIPFSKKIKMKWKKNAETVGAPNFETMIKLVDVNPMELASEAFDLWKAKLIAFIESGKWKDIMKGIPLKFWKEVIEKIGKAHYVDGVRIKEFKVTAFADAWYDVYSPILEEIRAMPYETDAEREARMVENRKRLIELKGKWRKA